MKTTIINILLAISLLGSSCVGPSGTATQSADTGTELNELPYDVTEGMNLIQVLSDLSLMSTRQFEISDEYQETLDEDEYEVEVPILLGLNADEVLRVVRSFMPAQLAYEYQDMGDGRIMIVPQFLESEDSSEADFNMITFDVDAIVLAAFMMESELEDEDCGDPEAEDIGLDLSGDYGVAVNVDEDPSGHSEYIGNMPASLDVLVDGSSITINGEFPWVQLSGVIDDDGNFSASGSGLVADFSDIQVAMDGQVSPDGLFGSLEVGTQGGLPGGESASYTVAPMEI